MASKRRVILGILGSTLDSGFRQERWNKWRPTVSLVQQPELQVDRMEILHQPGHIDTARCVAADLEKLSPGIEVRLTAQALKNPWDFEEVYASLHDWVRGLSFQPDKEEYLVHITTGTHVQQICLFLLTESRHLPARLIQTSPRSDRRNDPRGSHSIIDLDLSKYDRIAARFSRETRDAVSLLKSGIETRNAGFNRLIDSIEQVAIHSTEPVLLLGPTGSGKSRLARRIYELKKSRHQLTGPMVDVNCATLRGDSAMSALFGHVKGAFTGAARDRPGLLRSADGGLLFLDEIGELGADEQAMLLRALEEKRFLPLGGDREVGSDFQLIAGTNRDLRADVAAGRFREDLLARIHLWTFRLPGLVERPEDIEPNLEFELEEATRRRNLRVTLSRELRDRFLEFAKSPEARWTANFRDLNACVTRLATLAPGGRITAELLEAELERLRREWAPVSHEAAADDPLEVVLGAKRVAALDRFDRAQLREVVAVCRESKSLSAAGRILFAVSRTRRKAVNDADRLRKYLARFDLDWETVTA